MRITLPFALACLLTFCLHTAALAREKEAPRVVKLKHDYTAAYTLQRVSVRASCFPTELRRILAHIAVKTKRKPIITSGHRPHSGTSQHSHCYAADIRVPGVSEKRVLAAAATAPGIGGIGRYCNGLVHVDIGPKRTWSHCRRR
ncbi:MAG: DUF882 domain-containing protein [Rhizobium sp.]|nr:DUF882 domain-containing protein [Rhizobium sp.]